MLIWTEITPRFATDWSNRKMFVFTMQMVIKPVLQLAALCIQIFFVGLTSCTVVEQPVVSCKHTLRVSVVADRWSSIIGWTDGHDVWRGYWAGSAGGPGWRPFNELVVSGDGRRQSGDTVTYRTTADRRYRTAGLPSQRQVRVGRQWPWERDRDTTSPTQHRLCIDVSPSNLPVLTIFHMAVNKMLC